MIIRSESIGGNIIKDDENYIVRDNKALTDLVLSSTKLHPNKSTTGHKHDGQEEVYIIQEGWGKMELDGQTYKILTGDVVLVPAGVFHRVHAGPDGCYFLCVFNGERYDHVAVLGYD